MRYIVRPGDPILPERLGGKAGGLARLRRAGLQIPEWFVLAPEACIASLNGGTRGTLASPSDLATIQALVQRVSLAPAPRLELTEALSALCPHGELVAVRSSACDEDGSRHSFAGQLDSFLCVHPSAVAERVAAVWRSAFSDRALAYRCQQGLPVPPHAPSVLIQRMLNPSRSGVAFGADPVTGRRGVAVISALYGLGTALVSGEASADTYHVDREGKILQRHVVNKRVAHAYSAEAAGGLCAITVPDRQAAAPALTDDEIRAVAELARQTGRHLGSPQDIEWAIQDGILYLLQSRPITSLSRLPDPEGVLNIWDNSNIAESYGGVTTPLTFSFARHAYEEVYRQFCRLMGVPAATIVAHENTFRNMLGLIRGRVYYNLMNWYRVLALLPGFRFNRRFMEQMMGVREELPEEVLGELSQGTWGNRLTDGLRLVGTLTGLAWNSLLLSYRIRRFSLRLNRCLAPGHPRLEDMRADELAAHYRDLERHLLPHWDAPLINDFLAMIFFGVLRRLCEEWCGDGAGTLSNDLLCAEGGLISAEPAARLDEMARIAARHPGLVTCLCQGTLDDILDDIACLSGFQRRLQGYLEKFGDRCQGELKLESPTLHDDPLPLFRSVGQLASRPQSSDLESAPTMGREVRRQAGTRVNAILWQRPLRRLLFHWVLRHARARVRDRENLRFERTRLFGHVRRVFVECGRRFSGLGLLDDPRDIFWLEVGEILGYVEGTGTTTNLKGLVAVRKAEHESYLHDRPLPERFQTRGIPQMEDSRLESDTGAERPTGDQHKGLGCCRGIVRGPVRVITDPRSGILHPGEILVAERTDPGWITLFPSAAGLLVERGSLLSHSAIVCRELGIPGVISIPGLTRWLRDGDWVELDGASGIVRRLEPEEVAGNAQ
jgi:pyruvate,water dikinase